MPNRDPRLHTLLSGLKITAIPEGMTARLKAISERPQARGLFASLWVFEDLSFGLRHDLRYQVAAACAALVLTVGAWQGLSLTHEKSSNLMAAGAPDEIATLMEADPVLAGGL